MTLTGRECTPMPWINVMANAGFGFMVSAEGGGCTWSVNSQKNTLTPWSNDPGRIPVTADVALRDGGRQHGVQVTAPASSRCSAVNR